MIRIIEGLYLGNREAARDLHQLQLQRITHVVNCADELPDYHSPLLNYLALKLHDPDPTFHLRIEKACRFIDEARQKEGRVLVHCFAAISRSPAITLTYLMHHFQLPMAETAEMLGKIVWTDPDMMFLEQIAEHFGEELTREELEEIAFTLQGRLGEK